jgi:hypothetical protein
MRIARTAPTPGGAKTCRVHRIQAASARRKVIETINNNVVWTVSDSGYVECNVERKRKSASPGLLPLRAVQKLA